MVPSTKGLSSSLEVYDQMVLKVLRWLGLSNLVTFRTKDFSVDTSVMLLSILVFQVHEYAR